MQSELRRQSFEIGEILVISVNYNLYIKVKKIKEIVLNVKKIGLPYTPTFLSIPYN